MSSIRYQESGPDKTSALSNKVITSYSQDDILDLYSQGGLWASEEKLFRRYYRPGDSLLDIGCGTGRTSFPLKQMGIKVVGIDITRPMLKRAFRLAGDLDLDLPLFVMDAQNLAFKDGSFDHALFSYNGIELVPKLRGKRLLMREVYRIVKPGGTFIFSVHNLYALDGRTSRWLMYRIHYGIQRFFRRPNYEFGETLQYSEETEYLHCLTPRIWRRLLLETGFKVLSICTNGSIERNRWEPIVLHFGSDYLFYISQKPYSKNSSPLWGEDTSKTSSPPRGED